MRAAPLGRTVLALAIKTIIVAKVANKGDKAYLSSIRKEFVALRDVPNQPPEIKKNWAICLASIDAALQQFDS